MRGSGAGACATPAPATAAPWRRGRRRHRPNGAALMAAQARDNEEVGCRAAAALMGQPRNGAVARCESEAKVRSVAGQPLADNGAAPNTMPSPN